MKKSDLGEEYVKKVPPEMRPLKVSVEEINRFIKNNGGEALPEKIDAESLTFFRPKATDLSDNQFEVWRNGKREVYETKPEVRQAFDTFQGSPGTAYLALRIAKGIAGTLRSSLSFTPDFIARNFIRDQITASSLSKYGTTPFASLEAAGSLMKEDAQYKNWLKSGGARSTFTRFDSEYIESEVFKLNQETGFMSHAWNVVKSKVEAIQVASEVVENSTRLGEFKKTVGGDESPSIDKLFEGGFNSREVTVDFARIGGDAKIQALNAITAFWNVNVQGLDRAVRAFKEDPAGMAAKSAIAVTMPSVLFWIANHNDPRWKDMPNWERDLFWIVFTDKWEKSDSGDAGGRPDGMKRQASDGSWEVNNGHTFRIPKPFEIGVLFGSLPERALDAFFTDHPDAFKDFAKTVVSGLSPSFIPTAISPFVEQWANKSFFTGNGIVPSQLEKVLPEAQYTEYTSQTAKAIGKIIGYVPFIGNAAPDKTQFSSPMIVENYVQAWTGNAGKYVLALADKGLQSAGVVPSPPNPPTMALADIPFVKAFVVRYPSAKAQSIVDFYDRESKSDQLVNTVKSLIQRGETQDAIKLARGNVDLLMQLDGIKQGIGAQNSLIQKITKDSNMSPDDKRKIIDTTYYQMIRAASTGNQLMRKWDESQKK